MKTMTPNQALAVKAVEIANRNKSYIRRQSIDKFGNRCATACLYEAGIDTSDMSIGLLRKMTIVNDDTRLYDATHPASPGWIILLYLLGKEELKKRNIILKPRTKHSIFDPKVEIAMMDLPSDRYEISVGFRGTEYFEKILEREGNYGTKKN